MRNFLVRLVEILDTIGFSLIVGSVVYFIIGSVTSVVHGQMLNWTFCGSAHYIAGVEWCGIEGHTREVWLNQFIHRLLNVTIPWFMIFWGLVIVALCSLFLKLLDYKYPFGRKG
jgi:hypothetical protein